MPSVSYLMAAIFLAAGITFLLRALPFALKTALKNSPLVINLSAWIPLGAMLLLAVYVLFSIDYSSAQTALPYLAGAVVTVVVHLWRKNLIISMLLGTITCVVLANWVLI